MSNSLREYKEYIKRYLDGHLSAKDFQQELFDKFQQDQRDFPEPLFLILDILVADVDSYVDDPELYKGLIRERPGWYLNEEGLREKVLSAYQKLENLEAKEKG